MLFMFLTTGCIIGFVASILLLPASQAGKAHGFLKSVKSPDVDGHDLTIEEIAEFIVSDMKQSPSIIFYQDELRHEKVKIAFIKGSYVDYGFHSLAHIFSCKYTAISENLVVFYQDVPE